MEYLVNFFCTIVRSLFLPHHLFCFRTNFLLSNIFLSYPSCAFFSAETSAVIISNTSSSREPIYLLFYYCIYNPSCTIVILNCAPSSEPTGYFFAWRIMLLCYIAMSQRAKGYLPLRVQFYFEWCPIECAYIIHFHVQDHLVWWRRSRGKLLTVLCSKDLQTER